MWLRFFKKNTIAAIQQLAVKRAVVRVVDGNARHGFPGHHYARRFEISLSEKLGNISALGTNSGTDALVLALKALKIGYGDEVIVPAFGCTPIASCVSWVGATPVFVDIQDGDYAVNPDGIEEKVTPRTKAIIVAHLFGQPSSRMKDILDIAKRTGLCLIEDAAQSFGAKIKTSSEWGFAGTVGDIGCFSFSPTKLLAAPGNGGAVVVKDMHLKEDIDMMRLYGAKIRHYDYPIVGTCARLQEIHAAALLAQLPFLDYWLGHREKLARYYQEALSGIGDILLPREEEGTKRVWYRYVIRTKKRDELFSHLRRAFRSVPRLQPAINYPVPLPYFTVFESTQARENFPIAEQVSSEVLSLPLNDLMSLEDADTVCDAIKNFFNRRVALTVEVQS